MCVKQCQIVNDMIKDTKTTYYSSAISNNKYNQKVNNFGDFFYNKIAVLRNELTDKSINNNQAKRRTQFQCWNRRHNALSSVSLKRLSSKKSEILLTKLATLISNAIAATILKSCKETLPTFANYIINKSFETGCMCNLKRLS